MVSTLSFPKLPATPRLLAVDYAKLGSNFLACLRTAVQANPDLLVVSGAWTAPVNADESTFLRLLCRSGINCLFVSDKKQAPTEVGWITPDTAPGDTSPTPPAPQTLSFPSLKQKPRIFGINRESVLGRFHETVNAALSHTPDLLVINQPFAETLSPEEVASLEGHLRTTVGASILITTNLFAAPADPDWIHHASSMALN